MLASKPHILVCAGQANSDKLQPEWEEMAAARALFLHLVHCCFRLLASPKHNILLSGQASVADLYRPTHAVSLSCRCKPLCVWAMCYQIVVSCTCRTVPWSMLDCSCTLRKPVWSEKDVPDEAGLSET